MLRSAKSTGLALAGRIAIVAAVFVAAASCAHAQSAATQIEFDKLQAEILKPGVILTIEQGRDALAKLQGWSLPIASLQPEQRARALRTEISAALAVGDARRAFDRAAELQQEFGAAREPLDAVYTSAVVAGDAKLADDTLRRLNDVVEPKDRRAIATRRRWLKSVGTTAPDVVITAEDGTRIETSNREGVALLIDFWNVQEAPSDAQCKALRGLAESIAAEKKIAVIGVNADSPARLEKARAFLKKQSYSWPEHFEEKMTNAPITHEAFHAGSPPWHVLIDREGYIRAVGDASEPAFVYAVRAVLAEAREELAAVYPRTLTGEQAAPRTIAFKPRGEAAGATNPNQLPSNEEAASMLREARAFLKTGLKGKAKELLEEIVRKYPGTREAEDAKDRLGSL